MSQAIRPTADRLRESLFNRLTHWQGENRVLDARVIDLFAGTGALGLEAMSRGARFALFVDEAAEARALIRENVLALGLAGTTRIFRRDATRLGAAGLDPFTLAFLDPPYRQGLTEGALAALAVDGWLAPEALVIVEEAADVSVAPPGTFETVERRESGESQTLVLRRRA